MPQNCPILRVGVKVYRYLQVLPVGNLSVKSEVVKYVAI